ncbi:unnamed protein product [Paramecium sonneborni]|uniref:Uncharacterized protein n=1 Tax=Paramecium sonneborni TaxID=65129 RepID=A0A8S1RUW1_9CILI|nr:unnamed protein product [Paramecium sonneborni]
MTQLKYFKRTLENVLYQCYGQSETLFLYYQYNAFY